MYAPLSADIITAERWLIIMPMAVLSNFLIYCVVNAFTPGPGNILALNTVTNYGYKKGKPLFFGSKELTPYMKIAHKICTT